MLRNWLLTNTSKKRTVSNSAEKLDESSTLDVPTKIFASSSSEDQQQANEPHPQPHRKKYNFQTSLIELGESIAKNL